MIFTAVWTELRVSELIGPKWRCIHANSIMIELLPRHRDHPKGKATFTFRSLGTGYTSVDEL
jgi:hypothetical protein